MKRYVNPAKSNWTKILQRPVINADDLYGKVRSIIDEIKKDGNEALKKYTKLFDNISIDDFTVSNEEIENACSQISDDLKSAIKTAAENIRKFHTIQIPELQKIETVAGVNCWQKAVAIEKVGLYIPGGLAPLFSTVLMLGIPAKIAGCREIVLCTPPDCKGNINPTILFAAHIVGVTKIFKLGGVQAIGAMAYGAGDVPKVNKIFGPGNQYVMAAKQLVSLHDVAVDMPAGPSEVLVMADDSANPAFVASDLLSQAEHGPDSQVVLVTNSEAIANQVEESIEKQLAELNRASIAMKALDNSVAIILEKEEDRIRLVNEYAPEHLIIATSNYSAIASQIINAGSVFLGNYTPESAGDYASGTNHTLPTNGWAVSYSGVNLDSFLKKITFQEISPEGLRNIGPVIEKMAEAELLNAHKNAVTIRLK